MKAENVDGRIMDKKHSLPEAANTRKKVSKGSSPSRTSEASDDDTKSDADSISRKDLALRGSKEKLTAKDMAVLKKKIPGTRKKFTDANVKSELTKEYQIQQISSSKSEIYKESEEHINMLQVPQERPQLQMVPSGTIPFRKQGRDISGYTVLTNTSSYPITFKIEATSPQKFITKPCIGLLKPGASIHVNISLRPEHADDELIQEYFRIVSYSLPYKIVTWKMAAKAWKNVQESDLETIQFKCTWSSESAVELNKMDEGNKLVGDGMVFVEADTLVKNCKSTVASRLLPQAYHQFFELRGTVMPPADVEEDSDSLDIGPIPSNIDDSIYPDQLEEGLIDVIPEDEMTPAVDFATDSHESSDQESNGHRISDVPEGFTSAHTSNIRLSLDDRLSQASNMFDSISKRLVPKASIDVEVIGSDSSSEKLAQENVHERRSIYVEEPDHSFQADIGQYHLSDEDVYQNTRRSMPYGRLSEPLTEFDKIRQSVTSSGDLEKRLSATSASIRRTISREPEALGISSILDDNDELSEEESTTGRLTSHIDSLTEDVHRISSPRVSEADRTLSEPDNIVDDWRRASTPTEEITGRLMSHVDSWAEDLINIPSSQRHTSESDNVIDDSPRDSITLSRSSHDSTKAFDDLPRSSHGLPRFSDGSFKASDDSPRSSHGSPTAFDDSPRTSRFSAVSRKGSSGSPKISDDSPRTSHGSLRFSAVSHKVSSGSPKISDDFPRTSHGSLKFSAVSRNVSSGSPKISDDSPRTSHGSLRFSAGSPKVSDGSPKVADDSHSTSHDSPRVSAGSSRTSKRAGSLMHRSREKSVAFDERGSKESRSEYMTARSSRASTVRFHLHHEEVFPEGAAEDEEPVDYTDMESMQPKEKLTERLKSRSGTRAADLRKSANRATVDGNRNLVASDAPALHEEGAAEDEEPVDYTDMESMQPKEKLTERLKSRFGTWAEELRKSANRATVDGNRNLVASDAPALHEENDGILSLSEVSWFYWDMIFLAVIFSVYYFLVSNQDSELCSSPVFSSHTNKAEDSSALVSLVSSIFNYIKYRL